MDVGNRHSGVEPARLDDKNGPSTQARRQDFAAGGAKNHKGGAHFKNTILDVCSSRGAKHEMGGHKIQMRGGAGTTGPPAGDDPASTALEVRILAALTTAVP